MESFFPLFNQLSRWEMGKGTAYKREEEGFRVGVTSPNLSRSARKPVVEFELVSQSELLCVCKLTFTSLTFLGLD